MVSVSSDFSQYACQVSDIQREDFEELRLINDITTNDLTHSRTPAALVNLAKSRKIKLAKIYSGKELIAFFPFEKRKILGVNIIRPAFYDLTLDFVDLSCKPGFEDVSIKIFFAWCEEQRNSVIDLFMCHENSLLMGFDSDMKNISKVQRGVYYYSNLPKDLDSFFDSLSKSTRKSTRRSLRKIEDRFRYEVVDKHDVAEVIEESIEEFIKLHLCRFPTGSAMIPFKDELSLWIKYAISDEAAVFTKLREYETGEVVAIDLLVQSKSSVGLLQGGRRVEKVYDGIGILLMVENIRWAIENGKTRFEYLFGDQEYKRRFSSASFGAFSITLFTSFYAKNLYRIYQRLGRYFKSLR